MTLSWSIILRLWCYAEEDFNSAFWFYLRLQINESIEQKSIFGALYDYLSCSFFLFKRKVKIESNQNSKFQKYKMAKICVQSPEVVMTGE